MLIGILFIFLIFGVLTAHIAGDKGLSVPLWFLIGVLIGPFGMYAAWRLGSKVEKYQKKSSEPYPDQTPEFRALVEQLQQEYRPGDAETPGKEGEIFLPENLTKRCPECGGRIQLKAKECDYCNRSFTYEELHDQVRRAWKRYHASSG